MTNPLDPFLPTLVSIVYTMSVAAYFRRLQVGRFTQGGRPERDFLRMLGCGAYYAVVALLVYGGVHDLAICLREKGAAGWAENAVAVMRLVGIFTLHLVHEFKMGRDPQFSDSPAD
jgi:hypothetical protein